MHTFLEGVTSNFGCLRDKIGVVIKKDFGLIPMFYFLKAEYIWVLILQLDSKFYFIFFKFYFIFKLYILVLVLPNIKIDSKF